MIVSLVGVAALFVLLEAFFLAILQVLVYAGAVMVLFSLYHHAPGRWPPRWKSIESEDPLGYRRLDSGWLAFLSHAANRAGYGSRWFHHPVL